jgi:hypothetical protein
MNKLFIVGLLLFVGTIMLVQQNATNNQTSQNQTNSSGTGYTYNNAAQAKPDQTKFCEQFQNDDGTTGERCEWKSKGECKKETKEGMDHIDCHKRN